MDRPPPLPVPVPPVIVELTAQERRDLARARTLLENPGLAARLAHVIGYPIESFFRFLPKGWSRVVNAATKAALLKALTLAVRSLGKGHARRTSSDRFHKMLVGASGGLGGAFGLAALPVELPVSTTLMLRSIADIARSEGHDLRALPVKLACLEVFALGGRAKGDDAAESAYWAVRVGLARAVSEAAAYLAQRGVVDEAAPAIVRLVAAIAARFGVVVSEQVAAKAVPVVGAAGGSVINMLFLDHFQNMARGHFIVKRLEARYGADYVREVYESLE